MFVGFMSLILQTIFKSLKKKILNEHIAELLQSLENAPDMAPHKYVY